MKHRVPPSSSPPSYTRHRALQRFLRNDPSAVKRARSVQAFIAAASPLEQRLFFLDCHTSVWKCLTEALQQVEAQQAEGGDGSAAATSSNSSSSSSSSGHRPLDDVQAVYSILSALITQSPQLLRSKWQLRPLVSILSQSLRHALVLQLRASALSVLLLLLDCLQAQADASLLVLLSSAVNLLPFASSSPSALHRYLSVLQLHAPPEAFEWARQRRSLPQSEQQVVEVRLMDSLLAFSLQRPAAGFGFWLALYQREIFPLLYPQLFPTAGLSSLSGEQRLQPDSLGFPPPPPALLHQSVIAWLLAALPAHHELLVPDLPALKSVLSLLRLTFMLPPSSSSVQLSVLALYSSQWLSCRQMSRVMLSETQLIVREMVEQLLLPLSRQAEREQEATSASAASAQADELEAEDGGLASSRLSFRERQKVRKRAEEASEAQLLVSEKVLAFLSSLPSQRLCPLTADSTQHLLLSLLRATDTVLQSPSTPEPVLSALLSCLFSSFLSSPSPAPPSLWEQLQERMRGWLSTRLVVEQWRKALGHWTARMLQSLAAEHQKLPDGSRKAANATTEGKADDEADDETASGRSALPSPSGSFSSAAELLSFDTAFQSWLLFLRLPGPPLSIASLPLRQCVEQGIVEALTTILDAVHRPVQQQPQPQQQQSASSSSSSSSSPSLSLLPRSLLPSSRTLLLIFGPWLFDGCFHALNNVIAPPASAASAPSSLPFLLQPKLIPALPRLLSAYSWDARSDHSSLFAALCLIFTTRCDSECDPRCLSAFYHLLRLALASSQSDIVYSVLRHCASLFSTSLPAVHLLIPDFLRVIRRLLKKASSASAAASAASSLSGPLSSVFSYSTPSTPLQDSLSRSHTPLQRRDRVRMSLLSEEGEDRDDDDGWTETAAAGGGLGIGSGPDAVGGRQAAAAAGLQSSEEEDEGERRNEPPVAVRLACLSILQSWLALPYLLPAAPLPPLFPLHAAASPLAASFPLRQDSGRSVLHSNAIPAQPSFPLVSSYWALRPHLLHLLLRSLKKDGSSGVKSACLWGLFFLIQQEAQRLLSTRRRQQESRGAGGAEEQSGGAVRGKKLTADADAESEESVVCQCLFAILTCCRPSSSPAVSRAATEVLLSLAASLDGMRDMRWSSGYSKLRESLGHGEQQDKARQAAEGKDSDDGDDDDDADDGGDSGSTSALRDLNRGRLPEQAEGMQAASKRPLTKERRPLVVLVLIDSLCLIACEQLQLVCAALSAPQQTAAAVANSASAPGAAASSPPLSSTPERLQALAQLVPALLSCLLQLVMATPALLSPSSSLWPTPIAVRVRRSLFALLESALCLRTQQQAAMRDQAAAGIGRAASLSPAFTAPPDGASDTEGTAAGATGGSKKTGIWVAPNAASMQRALSSPSPASPPPALPGVSGLPAAEDGGSALLSACQLIEDAAAMVSRHLLVRMDGYAALLRQGLGPEQLVSNVVEADENDAAHDEDTRLHLIHADSSIVTCYQLQQPDARTVRVIVRDMTGKYVWDVRQLPGVDNSAAAAVREERRLKVAAAVWREAEEEQLRKDAEAEREFSRQPPTPRQLQQRDSSGDEAERGGAVNEDADHRDRSVSFTSTADDEEEGEDDADDADDSDLEDGSSRVEDDEQDAQEEDEEMEAAVEAEVETAEQPLHTGRQLVDSEGNTSVAFVDFSHLQIVEEMFAAPVEPSPRSAASPAQEERQKGGRGAHLRHFLQVRQKRINANAERPRSASLVSATRSALSASASAALPASPMLASLASAAAGSTPPSPLAAGVAAAATAVLSRASSLPSVIASFLDARAFLSDLYFPSPPPFSSSLRPPAFLCDNAKVRRALKLLDRVPVRETHKIGLLYIAPGQDSQSEILNNSSGSAAYEAFKAGLGWPVSLRQHRGFMGGLDEGGAAAGGGSAGEHSLYWCSDSAELMWHVSTMMPTSSAADGGVDGLQLHKKRQVGNDYVHVVWSEHSREYRANTISSHFNHVHIVVYPMHNAAAASASLPLCCRVQILAKPSVPPFGPLQPHMIVPFASLPQLVRLTAINANRAIRYSTAGYAAPYPTRHELISELVHKTALRVDEQRAWRDAMTRHERGDDEQQQQHSLSLL